jgi:hypothetical protein
MSNVSRVEIGRERGGWVRTVAIHSLIYLSSLIQIESTIQTMGLAMRSLTRISRLCVLLHLDFDGVWKTRFDLAPQL